MIADMFETCNKSDNVAINKRGMVSGWDLLKLHNRFRSESAPFTGVYFHYLRKKNQPRPTCFQRLKRRILKWVGDEKLDPIGCSKEEVRTGWREADMKNAASWIQKFIVKIKIWEQNSEVTYFGKKIKKKRGDWKRTFEIIQDHGGIYSYNIDHIPAYETIMIGVHEGTTHKIEHEDEEVDDGKDDEAGDKGLGGGEVVEEEEGSNDDDSNNNGNGNVSNNDNCYNNEGSGVDGDGDEDKDVGINDNESVVVIEAVNVTVVEEGPQ